MANLLRQARMAGSVTLCRNISLALNGHFGPKVHCRIEPQAN